MVPAEVCWCFFCACSSAHHKCDVQFALESCTSNKNEIPPNTDFFFHYIFVCIRNMKLFFFIKSMSWLYFLFIDRVKLHHNTSTVRTHKFVCWPASAFITLDFTVHFDYLTTACTHLESHKNTNTWLNVAQSPAIGLSCTLKPSV